MHWIRVKSTAACVTSMYIPSFWVRMLMSQACDSIFLSFFYAQILLYLYLNQGDILDHQPRNDHQNSETVGPVV